MRKTITGLVIVALFVGVMYTIGTQRRQVAEREAQAYLVELVSALDDYSQNREIYDGLIASAHGPAFKASLRRSGGRRGSGARGVYNRENYRVTALLAMIQAATEAGHPEIALELKRLRAQGNR
jgi:hypothetical protein